MVQNEAFLCYNKQSFWIHLKHRVSVRITLRTNICFAYILRVFASPPPAESSPDATDANDRSRITWRPAPPPQTQATMQWNKRNLVRWYRRKHIIATTAMRPLLCFKWIKNDRLLTHDEEHHFDNFGYKTSSGRGECEVELNSSLSRVYLDLD